MKMSRRAAPSVRRSSSNGAPADQPTNLRALRRTPLRLHQARPQEQRDPVWGPPLRPAPESPRRAALQWPVPPRMEQEPRRSLHPDRPRHHHPPSRLQRLSHPRPPAPSRRPPQLPKPPPPATQRRTHPPPTPRRMRPHPRPPPTHRPPAPLRRRPILRRPPRQHLTRSPKRPPHPISPIYPVTTAPVISPLPPAQPP